ncbi:MAG: PKD domain-containing protein [Rhodothermales bacterium]|nr:PKD domain-containing protein [Rhodothermales bacterium]
MNRRILSSLVAALVVVASLAPTADAQSRFRADKTVYLKARVGMGFYQGTRDGNPDSSINDYVDAAELFFGGELGLQLNKAFGLGLMFNTGTYPQLANANQPPSTLSEGSVDGDSGDRRTSLHLAGTLRALDGKRISPYLIAGVGATFGKVNGPIGTKIGFGPVGGAGIDIALSDQFGLFVEVGASFVFDGEGVDGLSDENLNSGKHTGNYDVLDYGVAGLRVNFSKPFRPVMVVTASGPSELLTNADGTFEATINPEATQPVTYTWDFGDGTTANGLVATHSYATEGTYTATFTARNKRSSDSRTMTVNVERPISAPSIITTTFDPTAPDTQSDVKFMANVRGDDREVTGYAWDFGDGSKSTEANPTHRFATPGTYTVTLRASNSAGSDTRTVTVTVNPYEAAICRELTDLNAAFFARNASALTDEARAALQDNVDILNECPNICVRIEGHAAPGERNAQSLSDARANAVQKFYTDNGVAVSRLSAMGMGRVPGVSRKEGTSQYRRADSIPGACM